MQKLACIGNDHDYKKAPKIPDPEQLVGWVQAYREGAGGYQNLIINAHLHLVMSIVGRYRKWNNYSDLEGSALLALTEAVVDAQTVLEDNQITPYITTCVRFAIKDAISSDRIVGMPGRTFRYKAAKGEIKRDGNTAAAIVGVVSKVVLARADVPTRESRSPSFRVPESKPLEPSIEIIEALNLATRTDQERQVIKLRAQGFGYADFEEVMGLKKSRVGEIVNGVEKRFNVLYA